MNNIVLIICLILMFIGIGFVVLSGKYASISKLIIGILCIVISIVGSIAYNKYIEKSDIKNLETSIYSSKNIKYIGENIRKSSNQNNNRNEYKVEKIDQCNYNIIIYRKIDFKIKKIFHINTAKDGNIKSIT